MKVLLLAGLLSIATALPIPKRKLESKEVTESGIYHRASAHWSSQYKSQFHIPSGNHVTLSKELTHGFPLEQFGGSSSGQRFGFYPPQGPPFFPQILFPPPPQLPLSRLGALFLFCAAAAAVVVLAEIQFQFLSFPFPYDPNQVLTLNDLITLITFILNNLGGFFGR